MGNERVRSSPRGLIMSLHRGLVGRLGCVTKNPIDSLTEISSLSATHVLIISFDTHDYTIFPPSSNSILNRNFTTFVANYTILTSDDSFLQNECNLHFCNKK